MADTQPGQVIEPNPGTNQGSPGSGAPEPERPAEQSDPIPNPSSQPETSTIAAVQPPAATAATVPKESAWQFREEDMAAASTRPTSQPTYFEGMSWTASEFIEHHKGSSWYGFYALAGLAIVALIYLLTKDKITSAITLLAIVFFGVFAARKPRVQEYAVGTGGIQIGQKFYAFQDFKTFSITQEGAIASIVLMPLKRFMPPLTVHLAPELSEEIIDFMATILPNTPHRPDAVDGLLRRIHF